MTGPEPDSDTASSEEKPDDELGEQIELPTLNRDEGWCEAAFRDAGEATFGSG